MLKVCVVSTESFPVYGGVGAYTTQLVEHLPEDIQVHLVSVNHNRIGNGIDASKHTRKRNLHFHYLSMGGDTFLYYPFFQLACLRKLNSLADEFKFDIIHTQFPVMPDILVRLFRSTEIPTICTVHSSVETQMGSIRLTGSSFSNLDRTEKGNFLLFQPLKLLQYFYLRGIEDYITVSNFVRKELLKFYPFLSKKNLHTVYHGVDTIKFSPELNSKSSKTEKPIVLFTGRMVAKKGPQLLIQAMPKVLKKVPNAFFVFAGVGNFKPYMKLLQQLRISEKNYCYLGYVESSQMPLLYNSASVYVSPSFEDSLGIRILEAMSCNKPVVASNVGGVPEIIKDQKNGLLIEPGNANELAEKIVLLLTDDCLRANLAFFARKTVVENFSVTRMANETAELYYKLPHNQPISLQ